MDKGTYREILDRAIEGEIEAHRFYQQVAERVQTPFLKGLFGGLAEEELMHRKVLEGFREKSDMEIHFVRVPDFHVSETVAGPPPLSMAMQPADAIALAMKKEEVAMNHYTQLAEACTDAAQQKVFLELAAMERGHKAKMEKAFVDIGYPEVW
ncbi:MAG: ferritin family protein [Desulfatitalea sp.]|nr:ferritin family protein [Desulfatitalea sp.]